MKVFNARFFGGTCIVAIGSFAVFVGLISLLPPTNNILMGAALVLAGVAITKLGFIIVKDEPSAGSKISLDTLRRAKLRDKNRKK